MRKKIKDREKILKDKNEVSLHLDTVTTEYVNNFGLPSGFASIEDLQKEIINIMNISSCHIIKKE